jgi:DNA-binding MarR family transcriptional regulator
MQSSANRAFAIQFSCQPQTLYQLPFRQSGKLPAQEKLIPKMIENSMPRPNLEYMLAVASHRMSQALAAELASYGIALEHWRILTHLADGAGWTMTELAEAALLSMPTATRTVDHMVGEALIYRTPHSSDRRKVLVFLSDKGRSLWSQIKLNADRCEQSIVEQYGDVWIKQLVKRLEHLAEAGQAKPRR